MKLYQILEMPDYDKELRLYDCQVYCYSPKQFERKFANEEPQIIGEVVKGAKRNIIGRLKLESYLAAKLSAFGTHSSLLYRKAGYVLVDASQCVVLLKSRLPLLIWLVLMGGAFCGLLIAMLMYFLSGPPVINPDNPLPSLDPNVQQLPEETVDRPDVNGGGSVSMIYTLKAELSLTSGKIGMYFKNPGDSTHDVVLELYLVSGGQEIRIGQSGRVPAGTGLFELTFEQKSAVLSEGQYTAKYKVNYYDPETGERDLVASDINDVALKVSP